MYPKMREWITFGNHPRSHDVLKSGDLHSALREFGFEQMMELRSGAAMKSDDPGVGFGVVLWLLGDYEGAGFAWAQITDAVFRGKYSHSNKKTFQAPLLLWFASVRLNCQDWHNLADRTFDKLLNKKYFADTWPGVLAQLLQRKVDLTYVESKFTEALRERQFPMAMFYAGVRAMENDDNEGALKYLDSVSEPLLEFWELEYYLAKYERARLLKERSETQMAAS